MVFLFVSVVLLRHTAWSRVNQKFLYATESQKIRNIFSVAVTILCNTVSCAVENCCHNISVHIEVKNLQ